MNDNTPDLIKAYKEMPDRGGRGGGKRNTRTSREEIGWRRTLWNITLLSAYAIGAALVVAYALGYVDFPWAGAVIINRSVEKGRIY